MLMKRPNEPFKGSWALPGGYNPKGETTLQALERIVATKTGVDIDKDLTYIEQLYTFDTVARDPRGHAVSVTYMGAGQDVESHIMNPDVGFFEVNNLPKLAFDHENIIEYAHQRLISKLTYTNAIFAFLPAEFTLTKLQIAYEAIMDRKLDKRNFRKKIQDLGFIKDTHEMQREGAHRPAKLYKFKTQELETLSRSLD
jgi:8-oxo-dGTP diphosphatase